MTFRFETLLRLRKNTEHQQQRNMARMQQHLFDRQRELQNLSHAGEHHKTQLQSRLGSTLSARTLGLYVPYFQSLSSRTHQYQTIILESEQQVETQRGHLIEAMKKRRALEILKDRELLQKRRKATREEIAFADEMGSVRWHRREP